MSNYLKNFSIQVEERLPTKDRSIEIVEKKGKGHPDSLCDALAERASVALNQLYLDQAGRILHYNLDKALLAAGEAIPAFGGGSIRFPMKMIMGDRATFAYHDQSLPIWETVMKSACEWIQQNLRYLDPNQHLIFQNELRQGSSELSHIFDEHSGHYLRANDTSAAVGFAPLTPTEKLVLALEHYMLSPTFQQLFPAAGEDIKIMAVRQNKVLDLTIALAMVDRWISSEDDYFKQKKAIIDHLKEYLQNEFDEPAISDLQLNTLDQPGQGITGLYLTVTGTSAEQGDSGQIGRGNQINGLICLHRPQSNEAVPGKNPVSHVGKIYNYLASLLAESFHQEIVQAAEVTVWLTSRIGQPIHTPGLIAISLVPDRGKHIPSGYKDLIYTIVQHHLEKLPLLCQKLMKGVIPPA